jgi:hypothetical protein
MSFFFDNKKFTNCMFIPQKEEIVSIEFLQYTDISKNINRRYIFSDGVSKEKMEI